MASIAARGNVESANLDRMPVATRKLYELLATVPAVGVAVVYSSLGTVSEVSGILVFVISCVFPPLYAWSSRRRCAKVWGDDRATTPLSMGGLFSAPAAAANALPLVFLALGVVLTILVTISVIGDIIGNDLLRAV